MLDMQKPCSGETRPNGAVQKLSKVVSKDNGSVGAPKQFVEADHCLGADPGWPPNDVRGYAGAAQGGLKAATAIQSTDRHSHACIHARSGDGGCELLRSPGRQRVRHLHHVRHGGADAVARRTSPNRIVVPGCSDARRASTTEIAIRMYSICEYACDNVKPTTM